MMWSRYVCVGLLVDEGNREEVNHILDFVEMDLTTPDTPAQRVRAIERLKEIGETELYEYLIPHYR